MKTHKMIVRKAFMIKNKAGHAFVLPRGYEFKAQTYAYQSNLIEMHHLHCEPDEDKLTDDIRIHGVPAEYIAFQDD